MEANKAVCTLGTYPVTQGMLRESSEPLVTTVPESMEIFPICLPEARRRRQSVFWMRRLNGASWRGSNSSVFRKVRRTSSDQEGEGLAT